MNIKKEYYAVIFILLIIFIIVIALVVKFKVLKKGGKSSTTTTEERIPFPAEGIFMAKNEDINKYQPHLLEIYLMTKFLNYTNEFLLNIYSKKSKI